MCELGEIGCVRVEFSKKERSTERQARGGGAGGGKGVKTQSFK